MEIKLLCLFVFMSQTNALEINSCSKNDFYLRKTVGRNLILPENVIDIDHMKTYQQCFGHCRNHNCSAFSFQKVTAENFKCTIYTGKKSRFHPSTRLRGQPSDVAFFERVPCQAPNGLRYWLKGRYPNATTCKDVQNSGAEQSGIYEIQDIGKEPGHYQYVYCEMSYLDGGWNMVLCNNGSIDFFQDWKSYKEGFGDYRHSFWAGLEHMHQLTDARDKEILIVLTDRNGVEYFAYYDMFYVTGESNNYRMNVTGYQTKKEPALPQDNADHQFYEHAGLSFRTWDKPFESTCPSEDKYRSGWWFRPCVSVFLTGDVTYACDGNFPVKGIMWEDAGSTRWGKCFTEARMLIRPRSQ